MKNKFNFVFGYNNETVSISEALANYNTAMQGYTYTVDDLNMKYADYTEFMKKLSKKYDFKEYDFSDLNEKSIYKQFISPEVVLYAQGNKRDMSVGVLTKGVEISEDVWKIYKDYENISTGISVFYTSYFISGGRVDAKTKSLDIEDLDTISELYYPYIDTNIMFEQFYNLQENILILTGAPGIGKSKMASSIIKHAVENPDIIPYDKVELQGAWEQYISVAYVKSTEVLSNEVFWRELESNTYDFIIIDDLDFFLTKRDTEVTSHEDEMRNKFLSQFLSYTDGTERNKTKFIITTNQPFKDLDTALLRKGRLFDILELRDLSNEEAKAIWKDANLPSKDFKTVFKDKRVLPADLGSEIVKRSTSKIKTALESYIKESGISKIDKAKEKAKVGF